MKKLLCILLSCILVFNSVTLVYADEHGGSGGSFDPMVNLKASHPEWFDENGNFKVYQPSGQVFDKLLIPTLLSENSTIAGGLSVLKDVIEDYKSNFDNSNGDVSIKYKDNGQPVTENNYNENNFYITYSPKFLNGLNDKLQGQVHALDGYYLFEPAPISPSNVATLVNLNVTNWDDYAVLASQTNLLKDKYTFLYYSGNDTFSPKFYAVNCDNLYVVSGGDGWARVYDSSLKSVDIYSGSDNGYSSYDCICIDFRAKSVYRSSPYYSYNFALRNSESVKRCLGNPFKVFYSYQDLKNYLNKGEKRSYAPKLPSTNLTIPLGYANGTLNLPDFNINLDSLIGKAEADIQADIDNQFRLYLDKLAEINVNPSQPTNPTPTPSGGGSGGDFGDGTTPTPAPGFTDGLKDTNDLLTQILEKVTSILQIDTEFSKSFETVSQNLCKYLESNNEKLDQIITAINALSNGKTEDEVNGCKYDFTELSQSLTSLWNDSDQKFDQMIKLLEENNKYQEKIIGDLNDIKAILIAQTVLDAFQNRSKETADKAKEKFPTSIPWDIAMIVNTFSAEPEPIKFELPIKVDSLNINETITVDLSSGEWEKLGKLCRYMLSVLFILFLIQLSRKLFSNGGDE